MAKRFSGKNPCEDKEWLNEHFIVKGMSREEIAQTVGCAKSTVNVWIWKHGLKREIGYTPEVLHRMHIVEKIPVYEIAKYFGVSHDTIVYQLRVNDIPYTPRLEKDNRWSQITPEWIKKNYMDTDMSIIQLARKLKVSPEALSDTIKSMGFPIKHFQDTVPVRLDNMLRMYSYNNLTPKVLEKHEVCEHCGKAHKLEVHHIITIKEMVINAVRQTGRKPETDGDIEFIYHWILENESLFTDLENLEALCHTCHLREHDRQSEAKSA